MTYDNFGRLATDTVRSSTNTTALATSYTYDLDDLVTSKTTTGFSGAGSKPVRVRRTGAAGVLDRSGLPTGPCTATTPHPTAGPSPDRAGVRTFTYDKPQQGSPTRQVGSAATVTNTWSDRGTLEASTSATSTTTYANDAFDLPRVVTTTRAHHQLRLRRPRPGGPTQRDRVQLRRPVQQRQHCAGRGAASSLIFRGPDGRRAVRQARNRRSTPSRVRPPPRRLGRCYRRHEAEVFSPPAAMTRTVGRPAALAHSRRGSRAAGPIRTPARSML